MEYKGYLGVIEFDQEDDLFHGTVINTNDVITFYGDSVPALKKEMRRSVDEYLDFCREQGREPERPFSGKILVRTTPGLHRRVALSAARRKVSMNAFMQEALRRAVGVSDDGHD
jgi:predicted HicB family RNase H-like nuclease